MSSPTEITVPQLSRLIGTPNTPVIIDVCIDEDFTEYPFLIPTARRHAFHGMASLAPQLRGKRVVVYCQKGKKISQGAAAILREQGVQAETLKGGIAAWKDARALLVPAQTIPDLNSEGRTVWVTKQRPKVDRIACPWLIRRFIDPNAQFLFVAPSEVLNVAEKFNATAFDVDGALWSHRDDRCTFDTMIEEFNLNSEPLLQMATVVRGADTNRDSLAPEVAGLRAASLGLSRMYSDDLTQLNAGMMLYDAFYRWARDASHEEHDSTIRN